jgi:hypothetical protein
MNRFRIVWHRFLEPRASLLLFLAFAFAPIVLMALMGIATGAHSQVQDLETRTQIAKAITVRIEGATQGSGVLVKREGNRYTVLTAGHVVSGQRPGEELAVYTHDGRIHQVEEMSIRHSPMADLATLRFQSAIQYTSSFPEFPSQPECSERDAFSPHADARYCNIYVLGFPRVEPGVLRVSKGKLLAYGEMDSKDGYDMYYAAPTREGMSGGPIIDEYGNLIGLHGRSETTRKPKDIDGSFINEVNLGISIYPACVKVEVWRCH